MKRKAFERLAARIVSGSGLRFRCKCNVYMTSCIAPSNITWTDQEEVRSHSECASVDRMLYDRCDRLARRARTYLRCIDVMSVGSGLDYCVGFIWDL